MTPMSPKTPNSLFEALTSMILIVTNISLPLKDSMGKAQSWNSQWSRIPGRGCGPHQHLSGTRQQANWRISIGAFVDFKTGLSIYQNLMSTILNTLKDLELSSWEHWIITDKLCIWMVFWWGLIYNMIHF